jgi:polyhydroxyalkanoate synthesis regulator phasin
MTDEELKGLLEANATENRRHFNEAADRLSAENRHFFELATEGPRHDNQLVAEVVAQTREELTRTSADHAGRIERAVIETQAMIKFSHDELHRRVRTLEETVADLQARVERLEVSAQ